MDEMPPALALPSGVGSSLCNFAVEIAHRKRTAEEAERLLSGPMAASGSDSVGVVEQIEAAAPAAALEEDGDGDDPITESDMEDSTSVEPELSVESSCSVVGDSSSISCAMHEFSISDSSCEMGTPTSVDAGNSHVEVVPVSASVELLAVSMGMVDPDAAITPVVEYGTPQSRSGGGAGRSQSMFLMESLPLWGCITICGRRPEMEDAVVVVPNFFEVPLRLLTGDQIVDGLDPDVIRLPLHFFGVYDGHGGAQVANYCREHLHLVLIEQLRSFVKDSGGTSCSNWRKRKWEKVFVACFQKIDDEVGGKGSRGNTGSTASESDLPCPNVPLEPVAPDTVGSTAVVAIVSSSHIIVANCGDSRAVLCRGKRPMPLSVDHKPNREDEYTRIEAQGGKVIHWYGYRVFGVLAMSRSIGDWYLKPWIIPEPEITFVERAREDECLIVASDGLWDVMSNEEVCDVARRRILLWHKKNGPVPPSTPRGKQADPAAQAAADCLSKLALQKGSKDNITIVVVDLKAQRKFKSK
ncbi:phosphatase 2C [Musa troglodytarum]|uniref:protein-serine/threonine phosphatase n=1 Tax=Musa troglodytarum TaxID=320322 RepID=A0A9E7JBF7_9LILI|nr:phosphatase 2C [Musa troglodytarum]